MPTAAAILGFGHPPPSSYLLLTNSQSLDHPPPSPHSNPSLMLHIPSRVLLSVSSNHLADVLQDKERMEERMGTIGKRRRRRLWETGSPFLLPPPHWAEASPHRTGRRPPHTSPHPLVPPTRTQAPPPHWGRPSYQANPPTSTVHALLKYVPATFCAVVIIGRPG